MPPVLDIRNLTVAFSGNAVVRDVSLTVGRGEIVALIGESGCGKTVTALSVLGLADRRASVRKGEIRFEDVDLLRQNARQRRALLGDRLAYVPQHAMRALNPVLRIGDQVGEPAVLHRHVSWDAARGLAVRMLESVHLRDPSRRAREFRHQLSGGMQQRAMIAMGLTLDPALIIADEPTTALDVTVQAQIVRLLQDIRKEKNTSILFITHDLGLAAAFCDRVYVMYAGQIVEEGLVGDVFGSPRHPYTAGLLAASPSATDRIDDLTAIPGQSPTPGAHPAGCAFAPRCPIAKPVCSDEPPWSGTLLQEARCWFPGRAAWRF